jgi:hypothetical protein
MYATPLIGRGWVAHPKMQEGKTQENKAREKKYQKKGKKK